jgi:hypothetical protein
LAIEREGVIGMNPNSGNFEQNDEAVLTFDVPDAALELAARGPAFSLPNSPTVSIIFACCGNDVTSAPA